MSGKAPAILKKLMSADLTVTHRSEVEAPRLNQPPNILILVGQVDVIYRAHVDRERKGVLVSASYCRHPRLNTARAKGAASSQAVPFLGHAMRDTPSVNQGHQRCQIATSAALCVRQSVRAGDGRQVETQRQRETMRRILFVENTAAFYELFMTMRTHRTRTVIGNGRRSGKRCPSALLAQHAS